MSTLITIEDALLDLARSALGDTIRQYAPLPGGLAQLATILETQGAKPPAVFATWRGSDLPKTADLQADSAWSLLAVTQHPAGELARRRGAGATIGGYEIAERLACALHRATLPEIGTALVVHLGPLDGQALADLAVSITEVRISLRHGLTSGAAADLADFLQFAGEIAPGADVALAREPADAFPL